MISEQSVTKKLDQYKIGGAEYTVTGSYEGTETLDKKLKRIMEQNAADDESDITEDGE